MVKGRYEHRLAATFTMAAHIHAEVVVPKLADFLRDVRKSVTVVGKAMNQEHYSFGLAVINLIRIAEIDAILEL